MIHVDLSSISGFVSQQDLDAMAPRVAAAHETLASGSEIGRAHV